MSYFKTTIAASAAVFFFTQVSQAQQACATYPKGATSYSCTCPPGPASGAVWGTGPYTTDSNLCAAAQHAGAIGANGGDVTALAADGQSSYAGSTVNGITTRSWGAYPNSFVFAAASTVEACGAYPVDQDSYACQCDAGRPQGSVWGSGPYTADSDICSAAIHAGAIGDKGGVVSVLRTAGLPGYSGSTYNGVVTRDWGSYGTSFAVNYNR